MDGPDPLDREAAANTRGRGAAGGRGNAAGRGGSSPRSGRRAPEPDATGGDDDGAAPALPPRAPAPQRVGPHPSTLPPMVITKPPVLLSAILLNEPWTYPMFGSLGASYFCCPTLHYARQLELVDPEQGGSCLQCCVCFTCLFDVLTLRLPFTGYPGLGTALFGCYTRAQLRLRYRIKGIGSEDFAYALCCAPCVVQQQLLELEKEGAVYNIC